MTARGAILLAAALAATPALALQTETAASGGILRLLDKITGELTDLTLGPGESRQMGVLTVRLDECRYPAANPSGDAFALVEIRDNRQDLPVFQGWMMASAPALHAMDHPRYDVWALRCITS